MPCCHEHKLHCGKKNDDLVNTETAAPTSEPIEGTEEEAGILNDEQRERLNRCAWLKDTLKSKRLTDTIDGILNGTDRSAELKKCRQNPEFESFVLSLLQEINS